MFNFFLHCSLYEAVAMAVFCLDRLLNLNHFINVTKPCYRVPVHAHAAPGLVRDLPLPAYTSEQAKRGVSYEPIRDLNGTRAQKQRLVRERRGF